MVYQQVDSFAQSRWMVKKGKIAKLWNHATQFFHMEKTVKRWDNSGQNLNWDDYIARIKWYSSDSDIYTAPFSL